MLPTPPVTDACLRDSAWHQQEAKGSQLYRAIDHPRQEKKEIIRRTFLFVNNDTPVRIKTSGVRNQHFSILFRKEISMSSLGCTHR